MNKSIGILIFASHPIQYNTPLYKELNHHFNLKVIYFSDTGLSDRYVDGIGKLPKWDIPLLDGYNYQFLKNIGSNKKGFFSKINLEIYKTIKNWEGEYIWLSGWNNLSSLMVLIIAKLFNKKILIRSDSSIKNIKPSLLDSLLKRTILSFVHKILYVGQNNKKYFEFYKQDESKFIFTPFSVDNDRFQSEYKNELKNISQTRKDLNIYTTDFVFLYVGKLIKIKGLLELVNAFNDANLKDSHLLIVGKGNLEDELKKIVLNKKIEHKVHFVGYKNQLELPLFYAISDVFVLPSLYEPWGLVVNEAMNCHLPLILSEKVGCKEDLLYENINGVSFNPEIDDSLKDALIKIKSVKNLKKVCGENSYKLINKYSYKETINQLKKNL